MVKLSIAGSVKQLLKTGNSYVVLLYKAKLKLCNILSLNSLISYWMHSLRISKQDWKVRSLDNNKIITDLA